MSAPLQLDTTREDWRTQARGKGNCRGCGEEVLWCEFDGDSDIVLKRPYNYTDGHMHFKTCTAPYVPKTAKPDPAKAKPAAKPKQAHGSLFGPSRGYGVE